MGLSFRDVVSTPRRNDRLRRPMLALTVSRSFLCSEPTTSLQDPPLRSGEKPIPLRYSTPTAFCLTLSLDSLSWPFLRVAMATICMRWYLCQEYFLLHCRLYRYDVHSQRSRVRLCGVYGRISRPSPPRHPPQLLRFLMCACI